MASTRAATIMAIKIKPPISDHEYLQLQTFDDTTCTHAGSARHSAVTLFMVNETYTATYTGQASFGDNAAWLAFLVNCR